MKNAINTVFELSMGYAGSRCLHAIADLGVADALDDSPRTAAELAASTGTNAQVLARALRLVSAHGIFEPRDGGYIHTPASRLLRTDHPQSLRSFVRMMGVSGLLEVFRAANRIDSDRRIAAKKCYSGRHVGVPRRASGTEPDLQ